MAVNTKSKWFLFRWWTRRILKTIPYPFEAVLAYILFGLARALPVDWGSGLGGAVARSIGPILKPSKTARSNLRHAFPDWDEARIEETVCGVWENLGRTAMEYPHIPAMRFFDDPARFETVGFEHLEALRQRGGPAIIFSGHYGNWELMAAAVSRAGIDAGILYRPPNNRLVEPLFDRRRICPGSTMLPKGSEGARQSFSLLRKGGVLAVLNDQKLRTGLPVPFFGRPAMTAPAMAAFAVRFQCPVIGVHAVRLGGCRFRLIVDPPLELPQSDDRDADINALLVQVNTIMEGWIRDHPEQWFWIHDRWPPEES